jgi:hypothetical protein
VWGVQVRKIDEIPTVVKLGVSEHKPKLAQAQAIKARQAKFKLRFAGQAVLASRSEKSVRTFICNRQVSKAKARRKKSMHVLMVCSKNKK